MPKSVTHPEKNKKQNPARASERRQCGDFLINTASYGHFEKPPLYFESSYDLRIQSEFFACARLKLTVFRGPHIIYSAENASFT